MRKICSSILAAVFAFSAYPGETAAEQPAQLIEQLRSDDFDMRKRAERKLEALGEAARAALEAAANDPDVELKTAAASILQRMARAALVLHFYYPDGSPSANIEFEATVIHDDEAREGNPAPLKLKTNAAGITTIKLGALGSHTIQAKSKHAHIASAQWRSVDARPGENHLFVDAFHGGRLKGIVRDGDGKPLKDAHVRAFASELFVPQLLDQQLSALQAENEGENEDVLSALSNEKGEWSFEHMPANVYSCVVSADGFAPALLDLKRVRDGETVECAELKLVPRKPATLEIAFTKGSGKPLDNTSVRIELEPVLTELGALRAVELAKKLRNARMLNPGNAQEEATTDEKGLVTRPNVVPGAYIVRAYDEVRGDGTLLFEQKIEIKPGETTQLKQPPRAKASTIKGRIRNKQGQGLADVSVALLREDQFKIVQDELINAGRMQTDDSMARGAQTAAQSGGNGAFTLSKVPQGAYVAVLNRGGQCGFLFGVNVGAEKSVALPEITWPDDAGGAGKGNDVPESVSGTVRLNGQKILNASVSLLRGTSNSSAQSDERGRFEVAFYDANGIKPLGQDATIVIRTEGAKPLMVRGPFKPNATYDLQREQYGALKVRVTDKQGNVLKGAEISITDSTDLPGIPPRGKVRTDSNGVANLKGLAAGEREINATAPGYFLPRSRNRVLVKAEAMQEVTLVLEQGVTVRGRLTAPEGAALKDALAILQSPERCVLAAPDGTFVFTGVAPGEYTLTAAAPGLRNKAHVKVHVPWDVEKARAAKLDAFELALERPRVLVVDCGAEHAGLQVSAIPAGQLERDDDQGESVETRVDSTGRAEFEGLTSGKHELLLSQSVDGVNLGEEEVSIQPRCGPFDSIRLENNATLKEVAAVKAAFPTGTASAKLLLRSSLPPGRELNEGEFLNAALALTGAQATCTHYVNDTTGLINPPRRPLVFGTAPDWFKLRSADLIEFTRLPAGKYRLSARNFESLLEEDDGAQATRPSRVRVELLQFELKDGQASDLGEVKIDLAPMIGKSERHSSLSRLLWPVDRRDEFDP